MRTRRVVIIAASLLFCIGFAIYIAVLYRQLDKAFNSGEAMVPTRIYSDVTRIAAPEPRVSVEARLKALAYQYASTEEEIRFVLHRASYPEYLLPYDHPTTQAYDREITLKFDGSDKDALLQAVNLGEQEIPEIFLEPELVATFSRAGDERREIRSRVNWDNPEEANPLVWKAIISVEDPNFMDHLGFDPRGILRAIWVNLRTRSFAQGGSTLSMQLVKNLMQRRDKNFIRKVNELFLTVLMEIKFEKKAILERYLDEVYLGQVGNYEIHGVAEGAKHFFGKRISDLNLAEIALLAGLIRGPHYYSPYRHWERAQERQHWVLKKMVENGHVAEDEAKEALELPVRLAPPITAANKAPYFTDFVKAELIRMLKGRVSEEDITEAGFRVYTTLNMTLNSAGQQSVSQGIANIESKLKVSGKERLEGALAAVDHNTGYIRALVGGRDYAKSNFNRILNMKRQVGSTFKPIVYLAALEKGVDGSGIAYGPGYPVEDIQWTLVFDRRKQKWTPRNYDKEFKGWINLRSALAHSVNTVAARLGHEVGVANVILTARSLGLESSLPQVPSLALGVAELSPIELLRAYATIANHGMQPELTVIRGITLEDGKGYARFDSHQKEAVRAASADLLTEVMQAVFTEGTARMASAWGFDRPAAGKTGTTSNYRDAWFAGYTPEMTAVVWVGMDQMPSMDDGPKSEKSKAVLTGSNAALPIWVDFMKRAHEGRPPNPFPLSGQLVDVTIDKHSGRRASRDCPAIQVSTERYMKDHSPSDESCMPAYPASVIETETP